MKILVLSADYPDNNGSHERMYVHTRNIYYQKHNIDVTVINFKAKQEYVIDGIRVISLAIYEEEREKYDLLISHQSNLRNHFCFLVKYQKLFSRIIFFFHGHEIMYLNHTYPKPFDFAKSNSIITRVFQDIYDFMKIKIWHFYIPFLAYKSEFVFVSEYVRNMFNKNVKISRKIMSSKSYIINNGISKIFEKESYDYKSEKKYDFITIRSNWDSSVYCIDLLSEIAKDNPSMTFLLIGNGKYFEYNEKPENLVLVNKTISHAEMIEYLNDSKCAINLTRQDTQGVMTCELETFGIPVITSDIPVAKQFFSSKANIRFISNDNINVNLEDLFKDLQEGLPYNKDETFYEVNTVDKEVKLIFIDL